MKKILFFTDKISYSGASKILTWLVNTLNFPDAEITLATHFMDSDQRFINNDIHRKVYESKFKNKIIKRLDIFIQLQNDILTEKYDLCVGFLPIESFFLIISKFFHKHKVIVCERSDPYLEKNFLINLCRSFFRFADGAVFQTAEAMNYYPNNIQDVSVVIPNPAFKQKKNITLKKNKGEICTSGRLFIKQKRQDILLKAFKLVLDHYDSAILKVYGDGPDYEDLLNMAKELKIENNVLFEGKVNNVEEKLMSSNLFVMSSDYEGIPNAMIEALQCGLPIVSTDCSPGGARVLIKNGYNGFIVPRGDYKLLGEKILELLNDDKLIYKMSNNSLKKVEEFDEIKILSEWENYLKKFL